MENKQINLKKPKRVLGNQNLKIRLIVLLGIMGGMGGCAHQADLKGLYAPMDIQRIERQNSLTAQKSEFPQEEWWSQYEDEQLNRLMQDALKDNPDMYKALSRVKSAMALSAQSSSKLFPSAGLSASVSEQKQSYNYLVPQSALPQGFKDYGTVQVDFKFELDFWGKNASYAKSDQLGVQSQYANYQHAKLILSTEVALSYAQLQRLINQRDTLEKLEQLQKERWVLNEKRFNAGLMNEGGVSQAKTALLGTQDTQKAIGIQITQEKQKLAWLCGQVPDFYQSIKDPHLVVQIDTRLPAQIPAELLGGRADLIAARLATESAVEKIAGRQAEFYPNINLALSLGMQSLGLGMLSKAGSFFASAGPALSLPIFNTGNLTGALNDSKSQYEERAATYNQILLKALNEVASNLTARQGLIERQAIVTDAVRTAQKAHAQAALRYESGISNKIELLTAEENVTNALLKKADIQSNSFELDVQLNKALGGGFNPNHFKTEVLNAQ